MPLETSLSARTLPAHDRVLAEVKRIVAESAGITPDRIEERSTLIADLGCDSLDVIEISMELEEHFEITVPDELAERDRTVGEITDGVLQLLGQSHAN